MPARIDHVILGVRDLDAAAARLREEFGLESVVGGRHVGWGTGNRIVPLGADYLEVLGVVDEAEAAQSFLGQHLMSRTRDGDRLIGWCVSVEPFDATATRLGLAPSDGSRQRPDGATLAWRSVGITEAMGDPSRPFFIEWLVPDELHPGRTPVHHPSDAGGIGWVEVTGDEAQIRRWLGPDFDALPVRIRAGDPELLAVGITTGGGQEIVLR